MRNNLERLFRKKIVERRRGRGDCDADEVLRSISGAVSNRRRRLRVKDNKKYRAIYSIFLAGETRFEHATGGFGDRCSTVEPLP